MSMLPSAASARPCALVSQRPHTRLVGIFASLMCNNLLSGNTEQQVLVNSVWGDVRAMCQEVATKNQTQVG